MKPTVFLAYPLTAAGADLTDVQIFVDQLRSVFTEAGWLVLPTVPDPERLTIDVDSGASHREVLEANLQAVTSSDVLIVLVPPTVTVSSIWVEFGLALGASVPCVVVAPPDRPFPFLTRLAVHDTTRQVISVESDVPPPPAQAEQAARSILAAALHIARTGDGVVSR